MAASPASYTHFPEVQDRLPSIARSVKSSYRTEGKGKRCDKVLGLRRTKMRPRKSFRSRNKEESFPRGRNESQKNGFYNAERAINTTGEDDSNIWKFYQMHLTSTMNHMQNKSPRSQGSVSNKQTPQTLPTFKNEELNPFNASMFQAREGGGSVSQSGKDFTNARQQMSSESLRGGMPPSVKNASSPPPVFTQQQPLPGTIIRQEEKTSVSSIDSNSNQKRNSIYKSRDNVNSNQPSLLNVTSTPLGKDRMWNMTNNSTPRRKLILPKGAERPPRARRKKSEDLSLCKRCSLVFRSVSNNVKNKWTLLLFVHLGLFLVLALYLVVGATVLLKIDGGYRHVVRGRGDEERVNFLRGHVADHLLNISLRIVLDKSRDAILDTIFMSDEMQAALMAFQISRRNTLPDDTKLEYLSDSVLRAWRKGLEEVLVKQHLINTMEAHGYQLSSDELSRVWEQPLTITNPNNVYSDPKIGVIRWGTWSSAMHAFCLMTTMGIGVLSPSHEGRAFTVNYAIFGIPLYSCVIIIWSGRFFNIFLAISRAKSSNNMRKVSTSEEFHTPTRSWNVGSNETTTTPAEASTAVIFISLILTIVYVIGIGPLVCGSKKNSFGERLEAAFLSLLLIKPPTPIPQDGEGCCGFIIYVIVGHILIGATLMSLKKVFSSPKRDEVPPTLRR